VTQQEWDAFERAVEDAAAAAAWTTVSGSLPPGAPADGYERLGASAVNVAMDTHALAPAPPALVKVNAAEAGMLTGPAAASVGEALRAAYALRQGIGGEGHAAAVTCGRDGAVLVAPDGSGWHGSLAAAGRFPVGSGDAFLAGLVTAL